MSQVAKRSSETTTARGQARREALVDVALSAFAVHGYRGASIATIAREAGISEAGLLHHFPSKPKLLFGVLEHLSAQLRQTDERLDPKAQSFCDRLVGLARLHEADPTLVRLFVVLSAESVNPEHPAHAYFTGWYETLRASVAAGFASDRDHGFVVHEADPALMARVVISILDGLRLQFLLFDGDLRIAGPLETFLDTVRSEGAGP